MPIDADQVVAEARRQVQLQQSLQQSGLDVAPPHAVGPRASVAPTDVLLDPHRQAEFRALGGAAAEEVRAQLAREAEERATPELPFLAATLAAGGVLMKRGMKTEEVLMAGLLGWMAGTAVQRAGLFRPSVPALPPQPPLLTLELLRAQYPDARAYLNDFMLGWRAVASQSNAASNSSWPLSSAAPFSNTPLLGGTFR